MRPIVTAFVLLAVALACSKPASAQAPADIVLLNGKIVTVDDRFTIGEALAIKGERVLAVGSNAEIEKHKGPLTRVLELGGRTVIPGLIDNHAHYMRAAEYWHREVRLDGVTSHQEALELIKHKAAESKPGEWVVVLGPRGATSWHEGHEKGDAAIRGAASDLLLAVWQRPSTVERFGDATLLEAIRAE